MSDRKKSRYAEKRAKGNMMYGPGCCGHTITPERIEKAKETARRSSKEGFRYHKEFEL